MAKHIVILYILVLTVAGGGGYASYCFWGLHKHTIRSINNLDLIRSNENQYRLVFTVVPLTVERRLRDNGVDSQIVNIQLASSTTGASMATSQDDCTLRIMFSKPVPAEKRAPILSGIQYELEGLLRIPKMTKAQAVGQNPANVFSWDYKFAEDGTAILLTLTLHVNPLPVADDN